MHEGRVETETQERGTPQGGVISPLLTNIALTGILEAAAEAVEKKHGKQAGRKYLHGILYADDLIILAKEKEHVETARRAIEQFLNQIGLNLKEAKTRIVNTKEPSLSDGGNNKFTWMPHGISSS